MDDMYMPDITVEEALSEGDIIVFPDATVTRQHYEDNGYVVPQQGFRTGGETGSACMAVHAGNPVQYKCTRPLGHRGDHASVMNWAEQPVTDLTHWKTREDQIKAAPYRDPRWQRDIERMHERAEEIRELAEAQVLHEADVLKAKERERIRRQMLADSKPTGSSVYIDIAEQIDKMRESLAKTREQQAEVAENLRNMQRLSGHHTQMAKQQMKRGRR